MMTADTSRPFASERIFAILALLALVAAGCGTGEASVENRGDALADFDDAFESGQEWLTINDLNQSQLNLIELQRQSIDRGLSLGKGALADSLNDVLYLEGLSLRYDSTAQTGESYVPPIRMACPFLSQTPTGNTTSCRAMADEARREADANRARLQTENPLDTSFDDNRAENEFWYDQGMVTGMTNESFFAVRNLRAAEVCDQDLEPVTGAFEAGVERGREFFTDKVNERFTELGMNQRYPDNITRLEVCSANQNMLAPALSRALDEADAYAATVPLCDGYTAANQDEAVRLADADARYLDGIKRGITEENGLAEESIFRVVPCNVGDPLVVDVDGDGVDLIPVTESQVAFDLFGMGIPYRTSWIQGDDALLALDRDGNGSIDSGRELFGNFVGPRGYQEVSTGFDHLAYFDTAKHGGNGDGIINGADRVFRHLELWQDRNGDGISQTDELLTPEQAGVRAITLGYTSTRHADPQITHRSGFLRTPESAVRTGAPVGLIVDAWLRYGHR